MEFVFEVNTQVLKWVMGEEDNSSACADLQAASDELLSPAQVTSS